MSEGMTTQSPEHQGQSLGQAGEPCEQCGSPLAADQRYCLNCGRRRGGPRVDYRQRMAAAAAPAAAQPPPAAPAQEPKQSQSDQRDYAPLAAVGGIAVLGLMLLVGVLIGKGDSGSTAAPAPVVVQREGDTESGESGAGADGKSADGVGLGGSGGSGGKSKSQGTKGEGKGESAADAGAVIASEDDLAELESETGEDAAKNALKLPDKIATPGAPPPIDKSKPPGGGEGGGMVIK